MPISQKKQGWSKKKKKTKPQTYYKKEKALANSWSFTKPRLERKRVLVFVSAIRFWWKPSGGFPIYEWSNKKHLILKVSSMIRPRSDLKKYCWYHIQWPRMAPKPKRRCNETGLPERWLIPESKRGGHYALDGCKGTTIIIGRASSS